MNFSMNSSIIIVNQPPRQLSDTSQFICSAPARRGHLLQQYLGYKNIYPVKRFYALLNHKSIGVRSPLDSLPAEQAP
jgi:hypothetical protein